MEGKNYGVEAFIVRLRDDKGEPMPGIELGDIGPKVAYASKDNGYLILRGVQVARDAILGRYIKVHKDGRVERRGNPKIGYATMMLIRRHISTKWPFSLAPAVATAAKYSIKRKQFRELGQELSVIDYQCQQQKVVPAVVAMYTVLLVGKRIDQLAHRNFRLILEDDDSLMSETHCVLCFSKAFVSETGLERLEWLRLACGGHGYSHYSGIPTIYQESLANATLEGENTILLLQAAKQLLKAEHLHSSAQQPMCESMCYLENAESFLARPCTVPEGSALEIWNVENVRVLLAQNTSFLLLKAKKEFARWAAELGMEQAVVRRMGVRLVQLARCHAMYFYYSSFEVIVAKVAD